MRLYAMDRVEREEGTAEFKDRVQRLMQRRCGKDYAPELTRKYGTPSAAVADAAESLFSLNRYAKHTTCTAKNRDDIYGLKNRFIVWLVERCYLRGWGHHEIVKPEKILECYCMAYGVGGCHRCDHTGVHRRLPELVLRFVVLRFVIGEKTYTWHQPAESITFEYSPKAAQLVDAADWAPERDKPIEMPRSRFAKAKALLRWVMEVRP
ncbi:MAG: hypothetical protein ABI895_29175 [Deltaproteobacteria bacterium]